MRIVVANVIFVEKPINQATLYLEVLCSGILYFVVWVVDF